MKIISLRGENVKRMKVFEVKPDGNTIIVSGKNGQGKSSLLDSIVLALGGKSSVLAKLTTKPIRDGEKAAFVEVDLGEYTVKRTWTERKDFLEILGKDGSKFSSPQKMLDELIGDLSFDPLEFTRLPAKKQRELLLEIADIGMDLDEFDKNYKEVFDKRTEIGRERDRLQGAADSLESGYSSDTPTEEINVTELSKELSDALSANNKIAKDAEKIASLKQDIASLEEAVHRNKEELKILESADAPNPIDVQSLEVQIENADRINKAVRARKTFEDTENQLIEEQKKYEKGTDYLKEQDEKKADALKAAKMPVGGLSFDDDGVTFKDLPFGQLSQAEQIKVSMAIAMAQNPKLRIIRIDDGSLLDSGNLEAISKMADAQDFQIWVEKIEVDANVGVVIEDGEIIKDNYKTDES